RMRLKRRVKSPVGQQSSQAIPVDALDLRESSSNDNPAVGVEGHANQNGASADNRDDEARVERRVQRPVGVQSGELGAALAVDGRKRPPDEYLAVWLYDNALNRAVEVWRERGIHGAVCQEAR